MGRGNSSNGSDASLPRGGEPLFTEADLIHSYSRAQALADGFLVSTDDLTPDEPNFTRDAGFNAPVALTASLAALVTPNDQEQAFGQDIKGRLWDLLNMARHYRPRPMPEDGATWFFPCIFWVLGRAEYGRRQQKEFRLRASLAPGDHGEPVVTLMFPNED